MEYLLPLGWQGGVAVREESGKPVDLRLELQERGHADGVTGPGQVCTWETVGCLLGRTEDGLSVHLALNLPVSRNQASGAVRTVGCGPRDGWMTEMGAGERRELYSLFSSQMWLRLGSLKQEVHC